MRNKIRNIIFRASFFLLKILGLHKIVFVRNEYYFIDKVTINLNDIFIEFGYKGYPDIIENEQRYNWKDLEKSIKKNGIVRRPQVMYFSKHEKIGHGYSAYKMDCKYKIWDGNHRLLIWSYLHNYNNPKIDVDLLTPYYSLSSIDKKIHQDGSKEYKIFRKIELIKKTYGPDSDRYK